MRVAFALLCLLLSMKVRAQDQIIVPFKLVDGWAIVVEGELAGEPNRTMLFDTGAVPSAINLRVAKRLELSGPVLKFSTMNRTLATRKVQVPGVRVGPIAVESLDMVVMDLSKVENALGRQIDAVIGLDLLARRNFYLDYQNEQIVFRDSEDTSAAIPFKTRYEGGGTYIVVALSINGRNCEMLFDTGTRDVMIFEPRLGGILLPMKTDVPNLNLGGEDRVKETTLQSVNIGSIHRQKQKAYVWRTSEDSLRDFDGLLGPISLGVTHVAFDFEHHLLFLSGPK